MPDPLLQIDGLKTHFELEEGTVRAVDGVSFVLQTGETLGLVGESGCGKSVTAMSILQLNPVPPTRYAGGRILFEGRDLLTLAPRELRAVRGNEIAMIFQEPMTSLNPVYTVGEQIGEVLRLHRRMKPAEAHAYAIGMLRKVGIPSPETRVDSYPHQMSGGMKQRVMIAMALACDPKLLIADEPTTALDVTIQAQILELLAKMQDELGMSILLITHSLGVVAETADHVAVMYAGRIVEYARTADLFAAPHHPYSYGLLQSLPEMHEPGRERLHEISGTVPSPLHWPSGCRFRTRCFKAQPRCAQDDPQLAAAGPERLLACHYPVEAGDAAAAGAGAARTPGAAGGSA
ncbi:MAG TPA: ABC transporter ATP-binding protein [Planctomycetota bacterium]|nr:ABC transporter ATP-binding protein [Planctomycetota bacterium]